MKSLKFNCTVTTTSMKGKERFYIMRAGKLEQAMEYVRQRHPKFSSISGHLVSGEFVDLADATRASLRSPGEK